MINSLYAIVVVIVSVYDRCAVVTN